MKCPSCNKEIPVKDGIFVEHFISSGSKRCEGSGKSRKEILNKKLIKLISPMFLNLGS